MISGDTATSPFQRIAMLLLATALVAFHLGLIFSGLVPNLVSRPLHLALALPWIFIFAKGGFLTRVSGAVLCAAGVAVCLWIVANQSALSDQYGFLEGDFQFWLAGTLLLVVLEGARRAIGWPLPVVAALALAAEQQAAGESAAAVATLDALAGHGETPEIYRDIAALKSLLIDSERTAEDRLMALEALASPGAPLRMLALEQIALVRLEQGDTEAAIEQLRAIVEDAEATADLRDRATSLMVALGVTPETAARPVAPSE